MAQPPTSKPRTSQPSTRPMQLPPEERARTDAELREIMKNLMDNPDSIQDLSDEDVIALKQRINPVNTFIPTNKSFAVASIINMRENDTRNFIMTSMIGFLYRRIEEYTPDFVITMRESYARKINSIIDGPDVQERRDKMRDECEKITREYEQAHRDIARKFLDSVFLFNPDRHIRRAHKDAPIDAMDILMGRALASASTDASTSPSASTDASTSTSPSTSDQSKPQPESNQISREAFKEATATLTQEIAKYTTHTDSRECPDSAHDDVQEAICAAADSVYRGSRVASGNIAQCYRIISEEIARIQSRDSTTVPVVSVPREEDTHALVMQLEDARRLLFTCRERVDSAAKIVGPYACKGIEEDTRAILRVNPPADVFYHFGRYIDANYEVLRILNDIIFQTPPDIENMIIYYDAFPTREEASEFIHVHESEFRADPKIIENGGATLLGPFRENRQSVDFYNRHTEVLRQMSEQVERDHKLGADITKKRVAAMKRANMRETGPDDAAGLERYLNARGIISQFGQRPELSREEREQLARAEQERAEFEAPDGTLVTRVLRPVLNEDGIPVDLQQSFFYTESANVPAGSGPGSGSGSGSAAAPTP